MEAVLEIRSKLKEHSDARVAASACRFFKESIECYGVKTPMVRTLAKDVFKTIKSSSKERLLESCEKLWASGIHEEGLVACFWSHALVKKLIPSDFDLLERWVGEYVSNWALCDTFGNHTVGEFLMQYPAFLPRLKKWARHENRWMKRAAAVSLIVPARRGLFLKEVLEIATILLKDEDDLVQKGVGWMLKVAAQQHELAIQEFVMKHKTLMPRTSFRYAIENMNEAWRKKALSS
jgi:3-methyladenine DNA glycosylase AlkD